LVTINVDALAKPEDSTVIAMPAIPAKPLLPLLQVLPDDMRPPNRAAAENPRYCAEMLDMTYSRAAILFQIVTKRNTSDARISQGI